MTYSPQEDEYPISTVPDRAAALLAEYTAKRTCKVARTEHADLIDALAGQGATAHLITRILVEKFRADLTQNTIRRHVRRECACR